MTIALIHALRDIRRYDLDGSDRSKRLLTATALADTPALAVLVGERQTRTIVDARPEPEPDTDRHADGETDADGGSHAGAEALRGVGDAQTLLEDLMTAAPDAQELPDLQTSVRELAGKASEALERARQALQE